MAPNKRKCGQCQSNLTDIDPHTICKSCRQPNPQLFYCSEDSCGACKVINTYKPLDLLLRKLELENLTMKLNKPNRKTTKNEHLLTTASKSKRLIDSSKIEPKPSSSSVPMIIIDDGIEQKSSTKLAQSKSDLVESDLESKMYSVISKYLSSLTNYNQLPALKNDIDSEIEKVNCQESILPQKPIEKMNIMMSIFEDSESNCVTKCTKNNNNSKCNYTFKISSGASDILINSTILSSRSQAKKLVEKLDLSNDLDYWPTTLNTSDLLYTGTNNMPNLKLHPKARQLHEFLFSNLKPALPKNLMGDHFSLPDISIELKNEFMFAREQLQNFLFMYSLIENYRGTKLTDESISLNVLFDVLCDLIGTGLEKQANFLGLLFREVRTDLLNNTNCKENSALEKLINGSIHSNQFFGPYVKELENIVKCKGSSYCIKSTILPESCMKLPDLPEALKDLKVYHTFFEELDCYFKVAKLNETDKIMIFKHLIPDLYYQKLIKLTVPKRMKSYNDFKYSFIRLFGDQNENILVKRQCFMNCKQIFGQSLSNFCENLEKLCKDCNYGTRENEMLRDQFIFNLLDSDIRQYLLGQPTFSYEEAIEYTIKHETPHKLSPMTSISSSTIKRKINQIELFEGFPSSGKKKFKADGNIFYQDFASLYKNQEDTFVKVKKPAEWKQHFGTNAQVTYDVYCPWTGKLLVC